LFIENVGQDKVERKRTKSEDKEVELYIFEIYKENNFSVEVNLSEPDALTFLADVIIFDNLNNKVFIRRIR